MMKILLVKPNVSSDTVIPPLGLGYIAKRVTEKNKVKILDCLKDNISQARFERYISDYRPDILGIQVYNTDKGLSRQYLKIVKHIDKRTITVIGGPYPSCEPEGVFDFFGSCLDFAFCGEAEKGFCQLVSAVSDKQSLMSDDIAGLIYRKKSKVKINKSYSPDTCASIGYPDWDLLKPEIYPPSPVGAFLRSYPSAPIVISRGCPYKCSFCAGWRITGDKVRYRTIDNVIAEIKLLSGKHGIREFHILDDNFTFNRDYVTDFCRSVINAGINAKFACPNGIRIDTIDEEVLKLMKKAGFYSIHIGIESGSQKILNYMGKIQTLNMIRDRIKKIKKIGMEVCAYFIIGYPGETSKDIKNTLKLAMSLPIDRSMFMNFLPIPGTAIHNELEKKHDCNMRTSDKRSFYKVNYTSDMIPSWRVKYFQIKSMLVFYMRPKILVRNLAAVYSIRHLFYIIRRVIRIVISV
ncbi:B12-binding domain-containing radical SAM protein [Elusimicrobiota bacterium]